MAELPGYLTNPIIPPAVSSPPGISVNLLGDMFGVPTPSVAAIPLTNTQSGSLTKQLGFVAPRTLGGGVSPMFGGELFDKIIVAPRLVELDYVLDDITWRTSVWSTFGDKHAVMSDINIVDNSGIEVESPETPPLIFGAGQLRMFDIFVSKSGDSVINALIVFEFPGIQGADQRVTGTRIMEFAPGVDWSEPVKETTQYLTNVLNSYTAKEQRIALRKNPRTKLSFLFSPVSKRESAALEALVYARQAGLFSVPFWPDAVKITDHALPGNTEIFCNTSNRKFTVGGLVILWRGVIGYGVFAIDGVFSDRVRLTAPIMGGWPNDGQTYAIPALPGRWEGSAEFERLNPWINGIAAEFLIEPLPDAAPAAQLQAYGYDVLEIQPNASENRSMVYDRTIRKVDFNTGRFKTFDRSGTAISKTKGFLWTMHGRAEIAAFRSFMARRKGRLVPFWVPTWQHDLELALPVSAADTTITVRKTGYVQYQFDNPARRYLCFIRLDGSGQKHYRKVTGVVEKTSTEILTLDSPTGVNINPGMCIVSFLNLVRLAGDSVELRWITSEVAESNLEFTELPGEVTV